MPEHCSAVCGYEAAGRSVRQEAAGVKGKIRKKRGARLAFAGEAAGLGRAPRPRFMDRGATPAASRWPTGGGAGRCGSHVTQHFRDGDRHHGRFQRHRARDRPGGRPRGRHRPPGGTMRRRARGPGPGMRVGGRPRPVRADGRDRRGGRLAGCAACARTVRPHRRVGQQCGRNRVRPLYRHSAASPSCLLGGRAAASYAAGPGSSRHCRSRLAGPLPFPARKRKTAAYRSASSP